MNLALHWPRINTVTSAVRNKGSVLTWQIDTLSFLDFYIWSGLWTSILIDREKVPYSPRISWTKNLTTAWCAHILYFKEQGMSQKQRWYFRSYLSIKKTFLAFFFYSTFKLECKNLLFAHLFIVNYPQYVHEAHMQFVRLQNHISILDLRP